MQEPTLNIERPEGWEKLPRNVSEALTADELDFLEHGLLTFLIGAINWKTRVYRGTLARLSEDVVWATSQDWLRKKLVSLREKKWIGYEVGSGPRAAWTIWLGLRTLNGQRNIEPQQTNLRRVSDSDPPSQSEIEADSPLSRNGANPDERSESSCSVSQTDFSLLDGDRDSDGEGDLDGRRASKEGHQGDGEESKRKLREPLEREKRTVTPGRDFAPYPDEDIDF